MDCPDDTEHCPIVGTLGSWCLYVLGIFMACVYLLGPRTSYGESEQNLAYWLQLFVAAKQKGAECTWTDPLLDDDEDHIQTRRLNVHDMSLWARFLMNFCINGVGFQILVHALPIQVAAESGLTGVGMCVLYIYMYIYMYCSILSTSRRIAQKKRVS